MQVVSLKRYPYFRWGSAVPAVEPATAGGVELLEVSLENVHRIAEFRSASLVSLFTHYLAEGRMGTYAVVDGRVVGHAWVSRPETGRTRLNRYFPLLPGEALIHYCSVDPALRGRGIFGQMLHELLRMAAALETPPVRVLVDAEDSNSASLRGIERAGFIRMGTVTVLRIAGRTLLASRAG